VSIREGLNAVFVEAFPGRPNEKAQYQRFFRSNSGSPSARKTERARCFPSSVNAKAQSDWMG